MAYQTKTIGLFADWFGEVFQVDVLPKQPGETTPAAVFVSRADPAADQSPIFTLDVDMVDLLILRLQEAKKALAS